MNYSRLPIDIEYCDIGYSYVWKGPLAGIYLRSLMQIYTEIRLLGNRRYNDEHFLGIL